MSHNSPLGRIPYGGRITPENVGDFLLFAAQNSDLIRAALVKALVAPGTWFPAIPQISDRDLVTAIRVTGLALSRCGIDTPEDKAWLKLRNLLIATLRLQIRPALLVEDIRRARKTIKAVAEHFLVTTDGLESELSQIEKDHDILKKAEKDLLKSGVSENMQKKRLRQLCDALRGKGSRQPKRGRRFDEHDQRKLAAVMLLVRCETTKEKTRQQVADALYECGVQLEADSLRALETRYRKTCRPAKLGSLQDAEECRKAGLDPEAVVSTAKGRPDAFIPRENLPGLWLERLGWFRLDHQIAANPPAFVAHLFSDDLKAEWARVRQNFFKACDPLGSR